MRQLLEERALKYAASRLEEASAWIFERKLDPRSAAEKLLEP
jgi:hypothetical protein